MGHSTFVTLTEDEQSCCFEIEVTHYDPGVYTGPMDGSYPSELEFVALQVSINDGPFGPVPDALFEQFEGRLAEKAAELATELPDYDDYDLDR